MTNDEDNKLIVGRAYGVGINKNAPIQEPFNGLQDVTNKAHMYGKLLYALEHTVYALNDQVNLDSVQSEVLEEAKALLSKLGVKI